MSDTPIVWSYGGGTQSVAIAILVARDELPRPDTIVIADTGREKSHTWRYTQEHVEPLLAGVGLTVQVAPHSLATVDLFSGNGDLLLPAFTASGGKLPTYCSIEWKQRVIHRHLRRHGYGPSNPVEMWIGISVDEVGRAKPSRVGWITHQWPLLFLKPMRREECVSLVESAGLPTPPRSSCWMCPHHRDDEWRRMRDEDPEDFARAVALEQQLREHDEGVYLHRSMTVLSDAPFDATPSDTLDLFGGLGDACDSGHCFV